MSEKGQKLNLSSPFPIWIVATLILVLTVVPSIRVCVKSVISLLMLLVSWDFAWIDDMPRPFGLIMFLSQIGLNYILYEIDTFEACERGPYKKCFKVVRYMIPWLLLIVIPDIYLRMRHWLVTAVE